LKTKLCGFLALFGFLGLATAEEGDAGVIDDFPDLITCTVDSGPTAGPTVFYIAGQFASNGQLVYRHPSSSSPADVDFIFNSDGTFNSKVNFPHTTNCDNKSLSQIDADGNARFFASDGQLAPTGAMTHFNLASCPTGWTQQIQLNKAHESDQPMVLCRKN